MMRFARPPPPPFFCIVPPPRLYYRLVKFEHTIFALPFAYVGAFLAVGGVPSAHDLVWITIAMVGARSLAMGLNRLIDAGIDARNPRTAGRELPRGLRRPWHVAAFCAASLAVFLVAVYQLDPLVRWLWPIPVVGFVVYPYLKRFTWLCHLWLRAPGGAAPATGSRRSGRGSRFAATCPGRRGCSAGRSRRGSPASTSSTRCSTRSSTGRRDCTRWPCASGRAASSRGRGRCTWRRSSFSSVPGSGCP